MRCLFYLSISYPLQFPLFILQSALKGFMKFRELQMPMFFLESLKLIGIITLVKSNEDLIIVVFLGILSQAILFFIYSFILLRTINDFSLRFCSFKEFKKIFPLAKQLFYSRFATLIFNNSDKILVGSLLGPSLLVFLDIISKIPLLIIRFTGIAVSTIVPTVGGLEDQAGNEVKIIYRTGFKFFFIFICSVSSTIFIFSDEILLYWVGEAFVQYSYLMKFFLLYCLISCFVFGQYFLIGLNRGVEQMTIFRYVQTTIKILFIFLMIDSYGLISIPLSYICSCLSYFMLFSLYKKFIGVGIETLIKDILPVACISIATILFVSIFHDYVVTNLLTLTIVFLATLLIQWLMVYNLFLNKSEKSFIINRFYIYFKIGK